MGNKDEAVERARAACVEVRRAAAAHQAAVERRAAALTAAHEAGATWVELAEVMGGVSPPRVVVAARTAQVRSAFRERERQAAKERKQS